MVGLALLDSIVLEVLFSFNDSVIPSEGKKPTLDYIQHNALFLCVSLRGGRVWEFILFYLEVQNDLAQCKIKCHSE